MANFSRDEAMASLSPDERAAVKKIKDPDQRDIQLLQIYLQKQSLLAQAQTNIEQVRHDMLKAVAENFRA